MEGAGDVPSCAATITLHPAVRFMMMMIIIFFLYNEIVMDNNTVSTNYNCLFVFLFISIQNNQQNANSILCLFLSKIFFETCSNSFISLLYCKCRWDEKKQIKTYLTCYLVPVAVSGMRR